MLKDEKGFAISAVIYSLIVLFLLLMLLLLSTISSRKLVLDKQKNDVLNKIYGISSNENVYKESILNGSYPIIYGGLVPITIENDGTVKKADITKEWYNYSNKKWANAVILTGDDSYNFGDVIPEANIESYFVWIPKYSYQLWDLGNYTSTIDGKPTLNNARTINIKFGSDNTNDKNIGECTTPLKSGESGNCKVGDYMTHPAFITMDTTGLWVGKFETTGSASQLTVKPNFSPMVNLNVKSMFELAYNYNRNLNSHMIKNTEWGAVAYLSHSNYGINTEININNNSLSLTGYSSTENADQTVFTGQSGTTENLTQKYNTKTGYKASTTGNIMGIYDMVGSSWEYTASFVNKEYGSSGFDDSTISNYDSKYFDIYLLDENDQNLYSNRILGDATGEMGPFYKYDENYENNVLHNNWYSDYSSFSSGSNLKFWFLRGGYQNNGIVAGQFAFFSYDGRESRSYSFRLILAP